LCGKGTSSDLSFICGYIGIPNWTQCLGSKQITIVNNGQIPTQIGLLTNLIDWTMVKIGSGSLPETIGCLTGLTSLLIKGKLLNVKTYIRVLD
jgi:hypothetical protein